MKSITRESVFSAKKAKDMPLEHIDVPHWDCRVYLPLMSGADLDAHEQDLLASREGEVIENIRTKLIIRVAADEKGQRVFTPSDEAWLSEQPAAVLCPIFAKIQDINGMTKAAAAVLEKNSD